MTALDRAAGLTGPRIGELFAGAGGIGMGLKSIWPDAQVSWVSDIKPGACKVLAHRFPDAPNLGDITKIDWANVEPVDIITGGYPCQPFSHAGGRKGLEDPRHLWPHVAEALSALRPPMAIFENVRGHLTLGLREVIADLELLGYSAAWVVIAASDVGACHRRQRIFILATEEKYGHLCSRVDRRRGLHRHCRCGGLSPASRQGGNVGQGRARGASDAPHVRREHLPLESQGASVSTSGHLGRDREDRGASALQDPSAPDGEARDCTSGPGVLGDDPAGFTAPERSGRVGSGQARPREGAATQDSGTQSHGTGPRATVPAEPSGDGGVSVREVVGAERVAVRPGSVRGEASDIGRDDRGPHDGGTCDECGGCVLAWPADANDVGRERGWTTRDRRAGPADSGHGDVALPTPMVTDSKKASPADLNRKSPGLRAVAPNLPTPRATDGTNGGPNQRGSKGDLILPSAVALLRTPMADEDGGGPLHPDTARERGQTLRLTGQILAMTGDLLPTPAVNDMGAGKTVEHWDTWTEAMKAKHGNGNGHGKSLHIEAARMLPTPKASDGDWGLPRTSGRPAEMSTHLATRLHYTQFSQYAPAIARWEPIVGYPAPAPVEPTGKGGANRLSGRFTEFMMGWPAGWVTDAPGVTRNEALSICGDGVVPQQAEAAVRHLMGVRTTALAMASECAS